MLGLVWQNFQRAQTNFYTSIKSKAFYQRQKQAPFKKYHEISFSPHHWLHCQTGQRSTNMTIIYKGSDISNVAWATLDEA